MVWRWRNWPSKAVSTAQPVAAPSPAIPPTPPPTPELKKNNKKEYVPRRILEERQRKAFTPAPTPDAPWVIDPEADEVEGYLRVQLERVAIKDDSEKQKKAERRRAKRERQRNRKVAISLDEVAANL